MSTAEPVIVNGPDEPAPGRALLHLVALITFDQRDPQPLAGATAMGELDLVYRLASRTQ